MITRKEVLSRTALAALLATTMGVSAPALAADAAADTGELTEVVITGSILKRTDAETPAPVTTLTADDLQTRGINTVAEALQRITATGAGTLTNSWNGGGGNFATGASAVSLRGLTVQTTLTIFDNARMAVYPFADDGHRNFVDLNTIPNAVVDRIEILKDGASSTYGADAIAGVINVITKKEITGIHMNGSVGTAVRGGGTERHLDGTWGIGQLANDGYNFYVNGEFQKTDPIWARDLSYPYNSENLSHVCDAAGHCMFNDSIFGITNGVDDTGAPFSLLTGSGTSLAPTVAPSSAAGARSGVYRLLNTAAGCNVEPGLYTVTLTTAQAGTLYNPTQCGYDRRNTFGQVQGEEQRAGGFAKFTAKVFGNSEFYTTLAYYDAKEDSQFIFAQALAGSTTPPTVKALSAVVLPIFVCPQGVGTIDAAGILRTSGCTTSTGAPVAGATLNPNNPFAVSATNLAANQNALLRWRYDGPRTADTEAKSLRGAMGLNGTFGSDWTYSVDLTASKVKVELDQDGNLIPQRIADVVAQGTFNFVNPLANSDAIRQYIAPTNVTNSHSDLWQAQAILARKFVDLPGGPLQAAIGASYRHEELVWQSANPDNTVAPYTRYYGINAVGAAGSRNVKSPFFEVDAPVLTQLEFNVSGRYDDYSSGQTNFSPKGGFKFKPVEQFALRGTYSKGFRIPSFNEAFGLPTTGYTSSVVNCTTYAAFCAAHGNNAYAQANYTLGTTNTGNPNLKPEKSTSWTLGLIFEPSSYFSATVDYFNIEVRDLIAQLSSSQRNAAIDQYYKNNGVVNIAGVTVAPAAVDPAFPNALPLLGFISVSYNNADREEVAGLDFSAKLAVPLTDGLKWTTQFDASLTSKYDVYRLDGSIERYAGTLGPCDYTSCAGTPRWHSTLSNTLSWEKLSLTGSVYWTSGYSLAEVDYGGDPTDCVGSALSGAGSPTYYNTEIPVACSAKGTWNVDMNAKYKINDKVLVYLDALNVLNIQPTFDPAAGYSASYFYPNYNYAWSSANAIGRFFRLGVRVDL
jgi:iron complex outermembrane receptor protein